MLAKLIAFAPTRDAAIDRLDRALRDYIILGTKTNVSWLRRVITHEAFRDGRVSTRFLEDHDVSRQTPEVVNAIANALVDRMPRRRTTDVWDELGDWGRGGGRPRPPARR